MNLMSLYSREQREDILQMVLSGTIRGYWLSLDSRMSRDNGSNTFTVVQESDEGTSIRTLTRIEAEEILRTKLDLMKERVRKVS